MPKVPQHHGLDLRLTTDAGNACTLQWEAAGTFDANPTQVVSFLATPTQEAITLVGQEGAHLGDVRTHTATDGLATWTASGAALAQNGSSLHWTIGLTAGSDREAPTSFHASLECDAPPTLHVREGAALPFTVGSLEEGNALASPGPTGPTPSYGDEETTLHAAQGLLLTVRVAATQDPSTATLDLEGPSPYAWTHDGDAASLEHEGAEGTYTLRLESVALGVTDLLGVLLDVP